jgi:large subunit ribosomal protein L25
MSQQTGQVELVAERRVLFGKKVKRLRREGQVPAVMYGHGFDPVPLQFEERNLQQVLSHVGGSQLIGVKIKGEDQQEMTLVRDVQRDPIRLNVLHVDLYRVEMTERITAEIPLEIIGESPVVESGEGILLQGVSTIEVECLPGDLVDALEVALSDLVELDQSLHVRDLAIPSGIDVLTDMDEMVARVVRPVSEEALEEELEEVLVPEVAEVEVITEAREEETAGEES